MEDEADHQSTSSSDESEFEGFGGLQANVRLRSYEAESSTTNEDSDVRDESSDFVLEHEATTDSNAFSETSSSTASTLNSVPTDSQGDTENHADTTDDEDGASPSRKDNSRSREKENLPSVLNKQKPRHNWNAIKELQKRQTGVTSRINAAYEFSSACYGSLRFVERLKLCRKLEFHNGCVNTLHFNWNGTRLASGSDDLSIVVWDWSTGEPVINYESGHRGNVFQAKFLPLSGDTLMVSCARDGHVRLAELSSSGLVGSTRRVGIHRGPVHKLALLMDTPHVFLSAGEDAVVLEIDVREDKPNKLLTARHGERKVVLYSVHANPLDSNEFCIGGRDQYVRVYDRRRISDSDSPLKKFCPRHLLDSPIRAHVTCATYNYSGSEILATYNDEDIYLFDNRRSDVTDALHRYQGHRNNATVKGVNFYGPKSEFIVSGSDCGNIFFWEKNTESIVQCMPGDENGVVNCLEPHPSIPMLATSGLDDDVKVWLPSSHKEPQLDKLEETVVTNFREREEERRREPDTIDGEMLWILWRHLRRTERRRRQQRGSTANASGRRGESSSSGDSSNESDDDDMPHTVQCAPS